MNNESNQMPLRGTLELLVRSYGIARVRAALARIARKPESNPKLGAVDSPSPAKPSIKHSIADDLERLGHDDPEKHAVLRPFYLNLRERKVLPESQDIRVFAQGIGLKSIRGKSRRDLLPQLIRFLLKKETEQIKRDLERVDSISEATRQQGFSVLTDKLLAR